jgi:urea transport system substrate-binding protein
MRMDAAIEAVPRLDLLGGIGSIDGRGLIGIGRDAMPRRAGDTFRVALCAPLRGPEGIWGPSCLASARLAQTELNRLSGIAGRPCELHIVDAADDAPDVEGTLAALVDSGEVDALVGMCISSVRQRIVGAIGGRVPFVYTCLYEGGDASPGLYAIGETAARQLRPSIAWLSERGLARRWMLVGNDYVWPRVSHRIARRSIAASGGEVVAETFLKFGVDDYSQVIDQLRAARADAVLISMVGQDAVEFNRAFGHAGLPRQVLRLSCAIEENQLLAIGADYTENLYVAMGYFAALQTDANLAFKERYHACFGDRAPALNTIGQSLYEGVHFLAALLDERAPSLVRGYASARRAGSTHAGFDDAPIYLALADGHAFRVLTRC